ncbi:MAG TPA: STN domain-containing protein, partial [Tepidisphaeraceae bacterium]|nr:STN domain-containing protein [Tepidisphaeraceae bacterium]
KSPYAVEIRLGERHDKEPTLKEDAPVNVARGSTMAEALEDMVQDTDATWYPWGKNIVIISKEAMVQLRMNRTITAQYNGVDVQQVLDDLAQKAGVEFEMEPGAIQRVPTEFRSIKLVLSNAPIRQVLDSIAGVTGLNYAVTSDGVYIWDQNPHPAAAAGNNGDRVIALLPMGNGMQLLVRNSDLPERLRRYAEQEKTEAIHRLEEQLKAEQATQPAPTTMPTTMPGDL